MARGPGFLSVAIGFVAGCVVAAEPDPDCTTFCARYDLCVAPIDALSCRNACAYLATNDGSFGERMGLCADCVAEPTCEAIDPSCWETACPAPPTEDPDQSYVPFTGGTAELRDGRSLDRPESSR